MTKIKLNEAALAAAKGAAREQWSRFEEMPAWIIEVGIRAYLSADPDRAARDAVVEAAKKWAAAQVQFSVVVQMDTAAALRFAVAALPKETPHD